MTSGDRIVIAIVAVAAIVSWPVVRMAAGAGPADTVVITGPSLIRRLPLDSSERLVVNGVKGAVTVVVRNRSVHIVEADCPDQSCVHQGRIGSRGQTIVCAPNGVSVWIGGGEDAPDAVVR